MHMCGHRPDCSGECRALRKGLSAWCCVCRAQREDPCDARGLLSKTILFLVPFLKKMKRG